jgi:hypothetical protein
MLTIAFLFLLPICQALRDPSSSLYSVDIVDRTVYKDWLAERASDYTNSMFPASTTDADNGAAAFWKIEEPCIQFSVAVQATGWVDFGISEAGGMLGTDVALFRAAEPTTLGDSYILVERFPSVEDCQHRELLSSITEGNASFRECVDC